MLRTGREIAVEIFGMKDEGSIRSKVASLSEQAKSRKIPAKRIGGRWYYDPQFFKVGVREEQPAEWLREVSIRQGL